MIKKIGIIYSSFNNYELLKNEVLKKVNFEGYPVINIDDRSDPKKLNEGKHICKNNNIYFEINKDKGVQFAVNQGIEFLEKKFKVEWVFCLQQDIFPAEKNFFSEFEKFVKKINNNSIGAFGFNIISEDGIYMNKKIIDEYLNAKKPKGWIGNVILSSCNNKISDLRLRHQLKYFFYSIFKNKKNLKKRDDLLNANRVFSDYSIRNFNKISKLYNGTFAIDLPMWGAIAINVKLWKKFIKPRKGYIFHLWFPDIAFQFMKNNIWLATNSNLYMKNEQKIKEKYGFVWSSAHAGKILNNNQVEKYGSHLETFRHYWGFDYEKIYKQKNQIIDLYKNTLIEKFLLHNFKKGPLKTFNN